MAAAVESIDLAPVRATVHAPFAVLLDGEGVVKAKGLVNTREQLESLFNASFLPPAKTQ